MASQHEDEFLSGLEKRYSFLNELSLSYYYSFFPLSDMEDTYINQACTYFAQELNPDDCNYHSLCISTQSALTYLKQMIAGSISVNVTKWCQYLSYWIYDNIVKRENCHKNEQLYETLKRLKSYYITSPESCDIMKFNMDNEKFMNKKKLYLLGEILYWIKEEYESISYYEQDLYNKFFGESANIYKEIVSSDNCEIKQEYNTELNNFIENFNRTKAYLNGKKKSISHDDLKSPDALMCLQDLKVKEAEELPVPRAAQKVNEEADHTGQEGQTLAIESQGTGLEEESGTMGGIAGPVVHMSDNAAGFPKEQIDENTFSPVGTIIGTSLGFVVPLITIYKVIINAMEPSNDHKYYESIGSFPTFQDYYNRETQKYQTEYVSKCDDINKHFNKENHDKNFKSPCQKIAIFIKYLKDNNYLDDKIGACKYINYDINKEIREFNNYDYENKEFYDKLINEFDEKIFNLSAFCTESIQYLDKNKFENMGKLYKLYSSFHKYINTDPKTRECNEIEKCVPLFKEYTQGCNGDRNDDFCNALLNFSNYAYSHNSVVMTCTGETSTFTLGLKRYTDEDGSVDESDFDTDISQNSVFIAFSIILVVSVTLFILYKFTPFGSFTRLKIHQNKKKFEKIQDRIHKIFRIHKHHLEDSNNNRFNMPYHPKQNYQLK